MTGRLLRASSLQDSTSLVLCFGGDVQCMVKLLGGFCRCEKRAQDLQLPHLFVYTRLALAQFALEHQTGSDQNSRNKGASQLSGASQGIVYGTLGHMYPTYTLFTPYLGRVTSNLQECVYGIPLVTAHHLVST